MKINLGSGKRKKEGFINIDNRREVFPDLICDVAHVLPFKENSLNEVVAIDLLEHLERPGVLRLMDEIYRVLKPGGKFFHRTPSDEGRGAWQDPYHRSAWNINTWSYYFSDSTYRDLYGTIANFKILQLFDEWTDKENKVLHTSCLYEAVK